MTIVDSGPHPHLGDPLRRGTLPAAWKELADDDSDRQCLTHGDETLTRGGLDSRSATAAARLFGAGVRRGDRVMTSAAPSLDLVAAHVAALRLGAVVVPVNGALGQREVTHIARDSGARLAVTDDHRWSGWLAPEVTVIRPDLPVREAEPGSLDEVDGNSPAMIGYTSGTTGAPKGAVLTHGNLLATAEAVRVAWGWTANDRLVLALPLFHMHGLGVGLHGTLTAGAHAVLLPRFDPDDVLAAVDDTAATMFFGVPTMYSRLLAHPDVARMRRLRLCVSGSAPLAPDAWHRFHELTGLEILERYGMTETGMLVSNTLAGPRRPGSVGYPLPGVQARIDGDPGEVLVRGPNVFPGYWRNPEATTAAFEDGWFRTGDLATVGPDGDIRLVGRAGDMVISGGENVYPREIEDLLVTMPGVTEVAVGSTPDPDWGEIVTAWIVAEDGGTPDVEAVRSFLADDLAAFKHPRIVHLVAELPRNALGKVQKHRLGAET
ncbi:MAG: AMP-binding protein [Acidimicrobiales bacterium]